MIGGLDKCVSTCLFDCSNKNKKGLGRKMKMDFFQMNGMKYYRPTTSMLVFL